MFTAVAQTHAITSAEVSRYLGKNRTLTDILLSLPFILLYASPQPSWRSAFGDVAEDGSSVLRSFWCVPSPLESSGDSWANSCSTIAECVRIGAGHLGIRASRLPWVRHRVALSAGLIVLFCLTALVRRLNPLVEPILERFRGDERQLASGVLLIPTTTLGTATDADAFLVCALFPHGRHLPPGRVPPITGQTHDDAVGLDTQWNATTSICRSQCTLSVRVRPKLKAGLWCGICYSSVRCQ